MTPMLQLVLLVVAFVCFVLATWGPAQPHYNRLIACGLAALVASMIQW